MGKLFSYCLMGLVLLTSLFAQQKEPCQYDPFVADMLAETQQIRWLRWIEALSGARPVKTSEGEGKILTRSNLVMFEPDQTPSAFTYLIETLQGMGFQENRDYEIHTYNFPYEDRHPDRNWKNLILTFRGTDPFIQKEKVLMVAHLDSISDKETVLAPGADDNASGAAGLLEAASVLRHYQFDRTIHLIWFSGEEYSRVGSEHFVKDYADWLPEIVGVVNLDMFAFDWDNDRCFEIHAGTLPDSQRIGECFLSVITAYDLEITFDFIDDDTAYTFSDHFAFWEQGVPGVMVLENSFFQPGGTCGKTDRNPGYHSIRDTMTYINPDTGFAILQASLATIAHMAGPEGRCFSTTPTLRQVNHLGRGILAWDPLTGTKEYKIWQSSKDGWTLSGTTANNFWATFRNQSNHNWIYQVFAIDQSGCQSDPGTYPFK